MANRPPNVIVFITHDTGRHVSPYGIDTVNTPNCERLAAEGVRFSNAFCTTPLCSPSRATTFTGRYPHQNGVMGLTRAATGGFDLYPGERHAAQLFAEAGYATVLCGFEHETPHWDKAGFKEAIAGNGGPFNGGGNLLEFGEHIDAWLSSRAKDQPFYMQIGCHETHHKWTADDTPPDESKGLWMPPYLKDHPELRREMAEFQGAVKRLDTGLGDILDVIDRQGLKEDTIFVFTTDHGIDVPRAKGTFYDPGLEIMLFMRYPAGGWGEGRVDTEMISNVDLLPTLLEACGLETPENVMGRSFLPLLTGEPYQPNEVVFAEKTYHDTYDPTRAIRTKRYKYIRYFEVCIFQDLRLATLTRTHYFKDSLLRNHMIEELYDLENDPLEENNLADNAAYANVKQQLRQRLVQWMKDTDDPLLRGPVASPYYEQQLHDLARLAHAEEHH